ncbi:phage-like element PBSX protein XepA [Bacillus velezensis]|uniref:phage-like element PBSX protein XepA n=1 Tax=Bacillus amyloliquefaciens group TaxID=1938374 RepID=UPI0013CF0BB1|nr:phage portal protein [Bacillus velezensis]MEC2354442.1 phage portal protein [Bacillus velezensis]MED3399281.1 phage portal protein [Bacillus velezensis]
MVKYQYEFPADRSGKAGAVKPYRGEKTDFVTPVSHLSGVAELLTNSVLKATEVYNQYGQDRLGAVLISKVKGFAYADRGGTLFIEESDNNFSWSTTAAIEVAPGELSASEWVYLTKRYYRFRYVNGNLQQSEFVLYQSLGAGEIDIQLQKTKPLPVDINQSQSDFVFHHQTESAAEGAVFSVNKEKKLLVEITGTAESGHVAFWGRSISGKNVPIRGIRSEDGTSAAGTSGTDEVWSFDIAGFKEIIMEIKSISGGSLSVKGTAFS